MTPGRHRELSSARQRSRADHKAASVRAGAMRALTLEGRRLALCSDYPIPRPPRGESLVRVRMAGICGTDLELARGYMGFSGVPGHEFVGEVERSAQRGLVGARVVGEINAGCARCTRCRSGLARHCPSRTVLGIVKRDGAFADYLVLPDENLLVVPDTMPDEVAVFAEPVAAALEIFENTSIDEHERVAVLGDGRLGAIVALTLRARGYETVIGGHHPEKLAALRSVGLKAKLESELVSGFDVVAECTGNSAGVSRALELVRPRGKVILKSTAARSTKLNLVPAVINEIALIGSRCGRLKPALEMLERGEIDPRPLVCTIVPFERAMAAISAARQPLNFKVLLKM
jgi:threonine dehydrogenase-like Zn-dependent dehydrogenase